LKQIIKKKINPDVTALLKRLKMSDKAAFIINISKVNSLIIHPANKRLNNNDKSKKKYVYTDWRPSPS